MNSDLSTSMIAPFSIPPGRPKWRPLLTITLRYELRVDGRLLWRV
jgi:hypothetical protein